MSVVNSIDELKKIAGEPDSNGFEGYISLSGGMFRSSKRIFYYREDDSWYIHNEIDDTEAEYPSTSDLMANEHNIVEAINKGALIQY